MYVDAVTLAALADELSVLLVDGRVQDVTIVSDLSFGLEIYAHQQRRYLLISVEPKAARCHLVAEKFRRGVEQPSTVALLIRKYVEGARLTAITQPAWERVLTFDFSSPEGETRLIAEFMDQRSNLILTAEGEILDSARRVGRADNRRRVILPRRVYEPPPPQDKLTPEQVTESGLTAILRAEPDSAAWRVLVAAIGGISPLLAREIIFRACEDSEATAFDLSPEIVFRVWSEILADVIARRWSPCIVPAEDGQGVRAFAAYRLSYSGVSQPAESMSAALAAYFASPAAAPDPYVRSKDVVRKQVEGATARVQRKLAALERQSAKAADIELLRKQGELILAYASTIQPNQVELVAQYDPDGPPLTIPLDPDRNAARNARAYFGRYDKAKRAAADVPALIAAARREADYLAQLATDLDLAESWPEIDLVREELQKAGYWQGSKLGGPKSGKPGFRRVTTPEGFVILIGRNAEQNHRLVTEKSKPDDLWLHVRERTGSHVIIRRDGREIPESVLQTAAELAAYYSSARADSSVEVAITERRYVRPLKGGRPGQVTVKRETVLAVNPRKTE